VRPRDTVFDGEPLFDDGLDLHARRRPLDDASFALYKRAIAHGEVQP
jgi:hypothetical protein